MIEKTKNFFQEVQVELSKVVWPTQEELKMYTLVVIISTAIVAAVIGVWDLILGRIVLQFFGIN